MSLLRGILFENMGLKLIALLLALVVYLHVYTERPATFTMTFPVQITDLSDSLAIVSMSPLGVAAELKGSGKQWIRLRLTEPRLTVSLTGVGPGAFQRRLTIDDLPIVSSEALQVSRFIGPQMIDLQIDRVVERVVPVAVRVEGELSGGSTWSGGWIADPPRVTVRGPHSVVMKLDSLRLAPVRLDSGRDTVRAMVGVSKGLLGCSISPPLISVRVPIDRGPR